MSHPSVSGIRASRPARSLVILAVALAALTACGSDGDSDDAGGAATTPATSEAAPDTAAEPTPSDPTEDAAGPQEVTVAAVDFGYELPSTEFQAGELTLELVNEGDASHNIVVERDGEDVASTDVIGPGESANLTVDLEPGEYVFYCSVGNHRAMGMEVMVTVT